MKCSLATNDIRVFYYHFDGKANRLQRIYQKCGTAKKELLFDRDEEIEKLKLKSSKRDNRLIG